MVSNQTKSFQKEGEMMKGFLTVKDVQEILEVKQSKAYDIIRELNEEMKKQGYRVVRGRVNEAIFRKTYFYENEARTG